MSNLPIIIPKISIPS